MAEQTLTELKQLRAKGIREMREVLDISDAEGRPLSGEERQKYDKIDTDVEALTETIDRRDKQARSEKLISADAGESRVSRKATTQAEMLDSEEYRNAFYKYIRYGSNALVGDEARGLSIGTDSAGGYLTETVLDRTLVQTLDEMNVMRQLCTVIATSSDRTIAVESDAAAAVWMNEEAGFTEDDVAFSSISLSSFKLGSIMKISDELLMDNVFDLTSYLATNFARRIGNAEEAAFVNGDGSSKPTGVTSGATASVTAASATVLTSDELIDLYHSCGRQYRNNASWLMRDSTIKEIRKLKDGNDQYIWQPGMQAGEPDRLFGKPVYASPDMPETATGAISVVFGDFSYYTIADRGARSLIRLNELFASNGQVGFRIHERVDGKVVLAEALHKITMA
jgi:HK97 family phage major capsid protein